MSLRWNGRRIKEAMRQAQIEGVDKTMSECVIHAKSNHFGWKNVTGTAEGSIRIQAFAREVTAFLSTAVVGIWGSVNVNYMIWLELKHGSALRSAADAIYPRLKGNVTAAFRRINTSGTL